MLRPDIEGRIRDLCAKAVVAEGKELDNVLVQLKSALREHIALTRDILLASDPSRAAKNAAKGSKVA